MGKQTNPFEMDGLPVLDGASDVPSPPNPIISGTSSSAETAEPAAPPQTKNWTWVAASVTVFCLCAGVGGAAFWWLTTPPPSPDCTQLSSLSTDMERLLCAQESARTGELPKILASLETLSQWPADHPLNREAQRLIAEWSQPVFRAAQQRIQQSDFQGAVDLANRIPKTSPLYEDAQAAITEWKSDWQKGEEVSKAARDAMKAQNWALASERIASLKKFSQDYWRYDRVRLLTQLLNAEQDGRKVLAAAMQLGQTGQPDQLGSAIATVKRINPQTFAWLDAQNPLKQWSETLLSMGYENWRKGNLNESMRLAQFVQVNPKLARTAQDLIWLAQASRFSVGSTTSLKPQPIHLWKLTAAISTVDLLQPDSRYYQQAQSNLKTWQSQLQDLTLLKMVWMVGEVPQPQAKQFAAWQAGQITPNRPLRKQAQTLVAYWRKSEQELRDRPYLVYAQEVAKAGGVDALQKAIAQARFIHSKRPLYSEAQSLIAGWTGTVQTIQDQPILDRAWALADQGDLNAAIQKASEIAFGRALYGQAQSAIGNWQAQIRAAELARIRAQEEAARKLAAPPPEPELPGEEPALPEEYIPNEPAPEPYIEEAPASEPPPVRSRPRSNAPSNPPVSNPTNNPPSASPPGTEPPPAPVYSPYTEPPPPPAAPAPTNSWVVPTYTPYEPASPRR